MNLFTDSFYIDKNHSPLAATMLPYYVLSFFLSFFNRYIVNA